MVGPTPRVPLTLPLVLREIFGTERDEIRGKWKNCIKGSLMICTAHQMLFVFG